MVGLVVSIALAAFGTIVLVGYVQGAHDKAAAGEPTVRVLVVTKVVPRGTKASALEGKIAVKDVPADEKVDGAVASVGALKGKVAATDLLPGEQVLAARFQAPEVLGREGVPKGLLEVTVRLSPERALGGVITPGDTVAVLSSFKPFDLDTSGQPGVDASKKTPATTHVILHDVLVTKVQVSDAVKTAPVSKQPDDTTPDPAPKGDLLVTLALDATAVQRVVFTAEYGTLWLSAEPSEAPGTPTRVETRGSVYG